MYCPSCGKQVSDSAVYCDGCGRQLTGMGSQQQEYGYSQTGYQSPQYRPAVSQSGVVPRIPSHLGWAIVSLIIFFWPTAIPAIVYASRVDGRLAAGDVAGAQEASSKAKTWCWVSTGIAILWIVIFIIVAASVGLSNL